MQQGYRIINYHQTEPRNASGILSLKRLIQYGDVTENTGSSFVVSTLII